MKSFEDQTENRWRVLWITLWIILVVIAAMVDRPVALWVHDHRIDNFVRTNLLTQAVKFAGTFWFTLLIVALLMAIKQIRFREMGFILLAVAMSGCNWFIKWVVGRTRPFRLSSGDQPRPFEVAPFRDGIIGLFHQKNLSFPSGHACTAFATAMAISIVRPGWRWGFFLIAVLVAAERVFENAHYVSDVVAGGGVGIIGVLVVRRILRGMKRRES